MFQFTREFIINDNKGKLLKKGTGETPDEKVKFLYDEASETLLVDNLVNIRKQDVFSIWKNPHQDEAYDKVVVTPDPGIQLAEGDLVRLVITLGQEGRVISTFNDSYPDHSRQLFGEAVVKADKKVPIADLINSIKNSRGYASEEYVTLTGTDTLTIEAKDCYTRVKGIRLVQVTPTATDGIACCHQPDAEVVLIKVGRKEMLGAGEQGVVLETEGTEGAGTVTRILKNMRLLTAANIDPFGTQKDERPVPGGKYTQYTVEMVTEHRHIGHQIMGAVDKSLSTIIFFVEEGAVSAFEAALENLGEYTEAVVAKTGADDIIATTVGGGEASAQAGNYNLGTRVSEVEAAVEELTGKVDALTSEPGADGTDPEEVTES